MPIIRCFIAVLTAALILGNAARAQDGPRTDKLNRSFASLTLKDSEGKDFKLSEISNPKAVVVVFLSFDCPVSTGYTAYLSELARTHAKNGVTVLGVVPTDDPAERVRKYALDYKLPFALHSDPTLEAADAFKAQATPEAFVLDHSLVLRYRGRIDDGHKTRTQKNPVATKHDLADALAAVLAGKDVAVPATVPVGCYIAPKDRKATGDLSV